MANAGLYRSNNSKIIAGVMGGIAENFGWNANLLRLIFTLVSILSAGFPGILIYLILWFVIPKQTTPVISQNSYDTPIKTINPSSHK